MKIWNSGQVASKLNELKNIVSKSEYPTEEMDSNLFDFQYEKFVKIEDLQKFMEEFYQNNDEPIFDKFISAVEKEVQFR